ncbi:MAG: DUF790 family protein [Candidatus Bathyarchaeota archaeon]|jgi:hypothetical protein
MLPPDLIRVKRRKGIMRPQYAGEGELGIAKTLISVYRDSLDKTRGELSEALSGCEELGYNYKLVRGLSWVLEQRCIFESQAVIPPPEARRAVFGEAGRRVVSTEEERMKVLSSAAFLLGVSTLELERSLYADLEDEQVLTQFETTPPKDLVKEYNFVLTVALLAHGKRLELRYRGVDSGLEGEGARIGEIRTSRNGERSRIVIEWEPTRRVGYKGDRIETLLSKLLEKEDWSLVAGVVYPMKVRRTYRLEINGAVEGRKMIARPRKEELIAPRKPSKPVIVSRPRGEIVVVDDLARRMRLTEGEVKEMYEGEGLLDMGGVLISQEKRDEILETLEGAPDMRLGSIRPLLRVLGVKQPVPVLEALGYDIEWNRDRNESRVYRINPRG